MTKARFALVILVAASTRSSRMSYKKLTANSTTRRLTFGGIAGLKVDVHFQGYRRVDPVGMARVG
jgi:hypothetical protein